METFLHQLPWCLRWCSRRIGGLHPQQHLLNRWWPYTKEQVKFHPVQSKDVHTATPRPRQKFAYFFSTKPEFVMPSGNLLHVTRRHQCFSKSYQILSTVESHIGNDVIQDFVVICTTLSNCLPWKQMWHVLFKRLISAHSATHVATHGITVLTCTAL